MTCTLEAVIPCLSCLCCCSVWRFVGRAHRGVWEPRLPLNARLPALLWVGNSCTLRAHGQSRAAGLWSWAISGDIQTPAESEFCFIVFIVFSNLLQTFHLSFSWYMKKFLSGKQCTEFDFFLRLFPKISKSNFCHIMSFHPSSWHSLAPTAQIFTRFEFWTFFENLFRKFNCH